MSASRPEFRGLDDGKTVKIYRRNLPHWRQDGATYFVTFRLSDSIPHAVIKKWEQENDTWLRTHGIEKAWLESDPTRYTETYQGVPELDRIQFEKHRAKQLHMELDKCHGCCALKHSIAAQIVADALRHFDCNRWSLGDHVIMPNHVHLIVTPLGDWKLEDILGSIKKFAARRIREWALGSEIADHLPKRSLWQQESYDRIVRDAEELAAYRKYIALNPGKAHLRKGEFIYFSATWLDAWTTPRL